MPSGRPPQKSALVKTLDGPEETKHRLRVILETISGELTLAQACEKLGIGESRFLELRKQALESALQGISPLSPGPKTAEPDTEARQVEELQQQVHALKRELHAQMVKQQLMVAVPQILAPRRFAKKKFRPRKLPDDNPHGTPL